MDPVTLILSALTVGVTAAAKDTAAQAVKDAYAGVKALLKKHFADKPLAEAALSGYEADQETWKKPLQKSLTETGAAQDAELVRQAQHLLTLVNPQQAAQGKYNVQIGEAKGTVIGDNANVTQNFGKE